MKNTTKKTFVENMALCGEYLNRLYRWTTPIFGGIWIMKNFKNNLFDALANYGEYLNRVGCWLQKKSTPRGVLFFW